MSCCVAYTNAANSNEKPPVYPACGKRIDKRYVRGSDGSDGEKEKKNFEKAKQCTRTD